MQVINCRSLKDKVVAWLDEDLYQNKGEFLIWVDICPLIKTTSNLIFYSQDVGALESDMKWRARNRKRKKASGDYQSHTSTNKELHQPVEMKITWSRQEVKSSGQDASATKRQDWSAKLQGRKKLLYVWYWHEWMGCCATMYRVMLYCRTMYQMTVATPRWCIPHLLTGALGLTL